MANDECEPLHMIVSGTAGTENYRVIPYRDCNSDWKTTCRYRKEDVPFGGMSIILMGDFGQLPPVGDRPMYIAGNGSVISDHGHSMYLTFDHVVILEQVMRQIGEDPEVVAFRALLMRMRDGQVTEMDWRLLIQHSSLTFQWINLVMLFGSRHSGRGASAATLMKQVVWKLLFLSTKAEVMLTCNLWAEVGLCNGSFGTIEQFWFAENMGPPNLPIAVLVHFPAYSGPAFLQECSKCIPVPPRLFEWMADGKYLSRQQLPLRLRYAMTIHKSQGQTLTKAVVDLGKGERVAGCTFVATSRVRSIHDIVFEPMTFDRLKVIGKNKSLKKRQEAERRLRVLAEKTEQRHKH
ncbi:ATP-dependent DNA helicase PIF1-like [Dendronephthya gigantea]|uniref:ATP-dependent DNA helicase PIF1-like n=1 Tax=Dendronephthya gigantea TaxID=151771 RepID=UPI001069C52E|nr:ATP-dependent DNA helicase PIF1-like [Dendronephthya gigantea]